MLLITFHAALGSHCIATHKLTLHELLFKAHIQQQLRMCRDGISCCTRKRHCIPLHQAPCCWLLARDLQWDGGYLRHREQATALVGAKLLLEPTGSQSNIQLKGSMMFPRTWGICLTDLTDSRSCIESPCVPRFSGTHSSLRTEAFGWQALSSTLLTALT